MIDGEMRANNFSLTAHVLITLAKSVRVTGVSELLTALQSVKDRLRR